MMGLAGTSHSELFFDQVRLGREHLLGGENNGMRLVLETLGRIRLALIGARSVGKAAHLLEMMVNYANERRQFGRPIGDFQMIQQMLADSAIEVNASRLMLHRAAWELDQGRDGREWVSMVKVHASEMLGRVADRAVQVFGGMGYCKDLPIERLYRDARIFRIFDGTSEIHRIVVARGVRRDNGALFDGIG
jgi:acyl-CoA dehydrogenase